MSDAPLILALPSKGRLKEQVDAWLADVGFPLRSEGERGYRARLDGLPEAEVRLLSAGDIAQALDAGEAHLGVTGEDLLRERPGALTGPTRVMLLQALGFGRADLVVAAPKAWLDVRRMADVDEVAALFLARTGGRLRVATKYGVQTRAFFARHGVAEYRIVESAGATEGAPAAGAAELVVDITTTGATLEANGLKVLDDGVILRSQAQLAASLAAPWTPAQVEGARRLAWAAESRARGRRRLRLSWPTDMAAAAERALKDLLPPSDKVDGSAALIAPEQLLDAVRRLAESGVEPVNAVRLDYVFSARCDAAERLAAAVLT